MRASILAACVAFLGAAVTANPLPAEDLAAVKTTTHTSKVKTHTSKVHTHTSKVHTHTSKVKTHTSKDKTHTSKVKTHTSKVKTHTKKADTTVVTTTSVPEAGISATITYTLTSSTPALADVTSVTLPSLTKTYSTKTVTASATASGYIDWSTYKSNGVNLGCWLELEYSCYEDWWASLGTTATDEWTLCEQLGSDCPTVMNNHYKTFMNTSVIDKLASVGVNTLRIPTTYAAWIDVPGSELYHGDQTTYLQPIVEYAIETYGMHIAIGLHSLPGGVNYLDIGEAYGHDSWFFNETNLQYSLNAVGKMLEFMDSTGYIDYFTVEPLNEAADNLTEFGTCDGLSAKAKTYIIDYITDVLELVSDFDAKVPVMFQDCFCGAEYWSPYFTSSDNLVIDTHVYYFADAGVYAAYADDTVCGQASTLATGSDFPVFIGEWALQVTYNNTYAERASLFDTQRYAWEKYAQGGSFWSAIHYGNATVSGEGTQEDYWSYLGLIEAGVITSPDSSKDYC